MILDTFVKLSSILTGYPEDILKPGADTQKLSEQYLAVLVKEVAPEFLEALNTTFLNIDNPDEASVTTHIMNNATLGVIARNIIKMWYLGIWYSIDPNASPNSDTSYIVSSVAYKNGMVWSTIYAHPMGYSEGNFGYWENPPSTDIITN